jgi:hypothetical protein
MTAIVVVNVSQTLAPAPPTLQKTGALISQGATNTSANTRTFLASPASLTPIILGAAALSNLTYSGGTVTATASANHGLPIGNPIELTIVGAAPAGYNGTFLCTPTTATAFTYPVPSSLASATAYGTWTAEDVSELVAMVDTFFAQGSQQGVWVLELGANSVTNGVSELSAWITANPGIFYSYLVPRTWDANAAFLAFLAGFESTTSKTYFYVTTTLATYQNYTPLMKCVKAMIECPVYGIWPANVLTGVTWSGGVATAVTTTNHGVLPGQYFTISGVVSTLIPAGYNGTFLALPGTATTNLIYALASNPGTYSSGGTLVVSYYSSAGIPSTEFSHASDFQHDLNYSPSTTNKVTPNRFAFLFGVTPFPIQGNAALLQTLQTANINIVGTGAQGGISNTILLYGTTMDGQDFNYWYSVDWVQINLALNITNALINGSNNPINPLYYNQPGIDSLQQICVSTMNSGVTFGLVLGNTIQTALDGPGLSAAIDAESFINQTVVNAVPFVPYSISNPNDYGVGLYQGFAIIYTPARGFAQIVINVNVTNFVA